MATITKKGKRGGYLIRIYLGISEGKKKFHSEMFYPRSKKEDLAYSETVIYANKLEKRLKGQQETSGGNVSWEDLVRLWNQNYAAVNLSLGTKQEWLRRIEQRISPVIGQKTPIHKITTYMLQSILTRMNTEEGLKASSLRKLKAIISSIFRFALQMNLLSENPADALFIPKSRKPDTSLHYFNKEQTMIFLNACKQTYRIPEEDKVIMRKNGRQQTFKNREAIISIHPQWHPFFSVAIFTGLRRAEIVALDWKNMCSEEGVWYLQVRKSIEIISNETDSMEEGRSTRLRLPKTDSSIRDVTLPSFLVDSLLKWKEEEKQIARLLGSSWKGCPPNSKKFDEDQPIFINPYNGERMYVGTPSKKFKQILDLHNKTVEESEKLPEIHLHDLRHTMATLLLASGGEGIIQGVSHRLGHSDSSTTLRIYSHWMKESGIKEAKILEEAFQQTK